MVEEEELVVLTLVKIFLLQRRRHRRRKRSPSPQDIADSPPHHNTHSTCGMDLVLNTANCVS